MRLLEQDLVITNSMITVKNLSYTETESYTVHQRSFQSFETELKIINKIIKSRKLN